MNLTGQPGLPLPTLGRPSRTSTAQYFLTTCNSQGRVANRALLEVMAWLPETRIALTLSDSCVILRPGPHGQARITGQGFLAIPPGVRNLLLGGEDQLFFAAYPGSDVLVGWNPVGLDVMVNAHLPADLPRS